MSRLGRHLLPIAGLALLGGPRYAPAAAAPPVPIAVIAHPSVPVEDLSLAELRRVFLGDRQFWLEDLPVTLLVPPPGARERSILLARVYTKTETQYRHYWIAKVFRTEAVSAPKVVPTDALAADLVRELEGTIAVVAGNRIPSGVKVVRINGKGWRDEGYPLQ